MLKKVGITGVGMYAPSKILSNKDMEKIVETSDEWITSRTGINQRHICDEKEATSDLATKAAKKALDSAGIKAEELDLIIVATLTSDMPIPSTACIVQKNLGAINSAAFDLGAACSGFVYAMSVGKMYVETGKYKNVLVIGAETMSRVLDWKDRTTCVLFGDGAGAVVLSKTDQEGIIDYELGSDGAGGEFLNIPAGGSRMPSDYQTLNDGMHFVKMNGSEVFKFAVRAMSNSAIKVLKDANIESSEIDLVIPHQANLRIIESSTKKLNVEKDKIFVNLQNYGNMSAASIPVALAEAVEKNLIKKGDIVLIVGFGAGLTWGSMLIRWCI